MRTTFADAAKVLLASAVDAHVVVGPAVWRPADGLSARRRYFMVTVAHTDGPFITSIDLDGWHDAGEGRAEILLALALNAPGRVIHDMGSELDAARLCAILWPCERTERLFKMVMAEQGGQ